MHIISKIIKRYVEYFVASSDLNSVDKDLFWQIIIATSSPTPRKFWLPIARNSLFDLIKKLDPSQKKDLETDLSTLVSFDWKYSPLTNEFSRAISDMNNQLDGNIWNSVIWGYVWMISWWALFSKRILIHQLAPQMLSQAKEHLTHYPALQYDLNYIASYDYTTTLDNRWHEAYKHVKNKLHCEQRQMRKIA